MESSPFGWPAGDISILRRAEEEGGALKEGFNNFFKNFNHLV